MELRRYLDILKRQKWFIAQAVVLVGLVAGVVSGLRTPVYEATARVLLRPDDPAERVGPESGARAPSNDADRYVAGQKDIAESEPVAREAAKALRGLTPNEVQEKTSVEHSGTSDVLEISGRDTDPVRARDIANAVARGYIENRRQSAVAGLDRAIKDIRSRLGRIQARIAELDGRIATGTRPPRPGAPTPQGPEPLQSPPTEEPAEDPDDLALDFGGVPATEESLKAARLAAVAQYQSLYSRQQELLVEVNLKRGEAELVSPPETPGAPLSPKPVRDGLLGATVGLLLGLGISFVREHLDDRIYSTADMERTTALPVLAELPFDPDSAKGADELPTVTRPKSPVAEAVRSLRTSLQFLQGDQAVRVVVVTSSGPQEGKSFVAANLAAAYAQAGYRTLLVSADLRRPHIDALFPEAAASDGLTGIVAQVSSNGPSGSERIAADVPRDVEGALLARSASRALVATSVPGLLLLPAGPPPPNPAEMLNSRRMSEVLTEVTRHPDVVIVDTPPLSAVTDAAILAARADGVFLVTAVGESRREPTRRSRTVLASTGTRLLGVVANKVHEGRGYYGYHSSYDEHRPKRGRSRRRRARGAQPAGAPPTEPDAVLAETRPGEAANLS